tara:strand:+ start:561 stop:752 length:192 start_codon:yes stop_codon:yes gene_type:complete
VIFVTQKEKYMIKSLMSILIIILCLSHCSSTDIINVGAGIYGGMEEKPNPINAIKMLTKKKDE